MPNLTDLIVWNEAASLAAGCVLAAGKMRGIAARRAAEQLVTAAESIPANIAEGYGCGVNGNCIRFLKISRGSTQEVENHLRMAEATRRLAPEVTRPLIDQVIRVRYLINRFMESVERRWKKT